MTWLIHEILQSWRNSLRRPGFLSLASVTLALGIGTCVIVIALIDAVLLAPPPYPQAEHLVVLGKGDSHSWPTISPRQYQLLGGLTGVQQLGGKFAPKDVNVAGGGDPDLVSAWPVDAGLLPTLGVALTLGRNFSAEEDRANGSRAAILGYAFWLRHFNGDTGVIGRLVQIDGVATPVVGVLPATFRLDGSPDVLLPLALGAGSRDTTTNLLVIARLVPGTSHHAASAAFDARLQSHAGELDFPNTNWRPRFSATSLVQNFGATAKPVLLLFLACALCVLLLVAVNLSNLMLLRAVAHSHASAVRAALGASIARLALPALGEGLLIGLLGAVGGLLLAAAALVPARAWLPQTWIAPQAALISWRVIFFAFGAGLAVAALFGVWRGRSSTSARELVAGDRVGASVASQRFGRALVIAQASLATLLLASSALLAHSLWKLSRVDLGFDASNVLVFRLNPASALYPDTASVQQFADRLIERLRAEPGVRDVALTTTLPIGSQLNVSVHLPDGSMTPEAPQYRAVSSQSFATFGIPLIGGRVFNDDDRAGTEPVVIVNAAFQRQYLHGNALGRSLKITGDEHMPMPLMRIVGVVGDVRQFGPQEAAPPIFYAPLAQVPDSLMDLLRRLVPLNVAIRVNDNAAAYADRMRAALREVDARQGVAAMRLLEHDVADATAVQRMNAVLIGVFAMLAMLLAGVGLYSVTSVAVTTRQREFGVRAALGASAQRLLLGVVGRGLLDVGIGLVIGLVAALIAARLLDRFLFGVGAADPLAFAATLIVLLAAGLAATALPAIRASRVAPIEALRNE